MVIEIILVIIIICLSIIIYSLRPINNKDFMIYKSKIIASNMEIENDYKKYERAINKLTAEIEMKNNEILILKDTVKIEFMKHPEYILLGNQINKLNARINLLNNISIEIKKELVNVFGNDSALIKKIYDKYDKLFDENKKLF
jgi:hypothetical protein